MDERIGGRMESLFGTNVVDSFHLSTSRSYICATVLRVVGDLVSYCSFRLPGASVLAYSDWLLQ